MVAKAILDIIAFTLICAIYGSGLGSTNEKVREDRLEFWVVLFLTISAIACANIAGSL